MTPSITTYYVVDAFTSVPFAGNAAGVMVCGGEPGDTCLRLLGGRSHPARLSCLSPLARPAGSSAETGDPSPLSLMQQVAAEVNLSETAFTWKAAGSAEYAIRYFTPTVEIALCGHATLAAAKVLWGTGAVPSSEAIVFRTGVGGQELRCAFKGGRIEMVFPGDQLDAVEGEEKAELLGAFGCGGDFRALGAYKGRLNQDYLLAVPEEVFSRLDRCLNMQRIQEVNERYGVRGVIVTARAGGREVADGGVAVADGGVAVDIKSRFFSPNAGIPEDPVTGSSFPTLAAFYKLSKFVGLQDHPRRKGIVHVERLEESGQTAISGDAVIVSRNEWLV